MKPLFWGSLLGWMGIAFAPAPAMTPTPVFESELTITYYYLPG